MNRHFEATIHPETAAAVAANTQHVINGYSFFKYLPGIQVGTTVTPIKVVLSGAFAKRVGQEGRVITITPAGFFNEDGTQDTEMWTINMVLGEASFRFGVRFKFENGKMHAN